MVVVCFSLAVSSLSLLFPVLALSLGYSGSLIGILVSCAAALQIVTRFGLPWLLSRQCERNLLVAATVLIALSALSLLVVTGVGGLVLSQVFQGPARAIFWTSIQAYVVRGRGRPIQRLAQTQMASTVGAVLGPASAGTVAAISLRGALWGTVVGAILAAGSGMLLERRVVVPRGPRSARKGLWRQREVSIGCWASFVAGGWKGILDSFVPVVLSGAGLGAAIIGILLSVSEVAAFAASAWMSFVRKFAMKRALILSAASVLFGAAFLPLVAASPLLAALALFSGGFGGGLTTTLGPTIANLNSTDAERGSAFAATGAYRSAARMSSPTAIAGLGSVLGTSTAIGVAAFALVLPVLLLSRRMDHGPR